MAALENSWRSQTAELICRLYRLVGQNYCLESLSKGTVQMEPESSSSELLELTVDIVSAYVSKNAVVRADLPDLIDQTFNALREAEAKRSQPLKEKLDPAISINKSVTPDFIICLECGKNFKSLKRHIRTDYTLTPDEYREKWGLPYDYPMVAPNYAAARSALARKMGLGRKGKS